MDEVAVLKIGISAISAVTTLLCAMVGYFLKEVVRTNNEMRIDLARISEKVKNNEKKIETFDRIGCNIYQKPVAHQ